MTETTFGQLHDGDRFRFQLSSSDSEFVCVLRCGRRLARRVFDSVPTGGYLDTEPVAFVAPSPRRARELSKDFARERRRVKSLLDLAVAMGANPDVLRRLRDAHQSLIVATACLDVQFNLIK